MPARTELQDSLETSVGLDHRAAGRAVGFAVATIGEELATADGGGLEMTAGVDADGLASDPHAASNEAITSAAVRRATTVARSVILPSLDWAKPTPPVQRECKDSLRLTRGRNVAT